MTPDAGDDGGRLPTNRIDHAREEKRAMADEQAQGAGADPAPTGETPEAETIDGLVFVTNPDYPYPFKVARPPRFWMEEQTGVLSDAVETYLEGERLTPAQLAAIKVYLKQFVERAPLAGEAKVHLLVQQIDRLRTTRDIENFADEAAEYGAEVF